MCKRVWFVASVVHGDNKWLNTAKSVAKPWFPGRADCDISLVYCHVAIMDAYTFGKLGTSSTASATEPWQRPRKVRASNLRSQWMVWPASWLHAFLRLTASTIYNIYIYYPPLTLGFVGGMLKNTTPMSWGKSKMCQKPQVLSHDAKTSKIRKLTTPSWGFLELEKCRTKRMTGDLCAKNNLLAKPGHRKKLGLKFK